VARGEAREAGRPAAHAVAVWQVVVVIAYPFVFPLVFTVVGGDVAWVEAWAFGALFAATVWALSIHLVRHEPALFRERFTSLVQRGQAGWDRVLLPLLLAGILAWTVLIPLDARRFGWSPPLPVWARSLGAALCVVFALVMVWTFRTNPFLFHAVKVDEARGHHVVTTGPYRFVRHPMYAAIACMLLGAPLLLGSVYGLLLGLVLAALFWVRSVLEERVLLARLPGYPEYARRVRGRLVPNVLPPAPRSR